LKIAKGTAAMGKDAVLLYLENVVYIFSLVFFSDAGQSPKKKEET